MRENKEMNFSDLKKNRRANFDKLQKEVEKTKNPTNRYKDERFWELTPDKAGNASATIRFLPTAKGDKFPYAMYFNHFFKGKGGLYGENCLTSVNKPDPVVEYNKTVFE